MATKDGIQLGKLCSANPDRIEDKLEISTVPLKGTVRIVPTDLRLGGATCAMFRVASVVDKFVVDFR